MSNPPKQKGTAFETALVKWFRDHSWKADRLTLAGSKDEGDLCITDRYGGIYVVEAKATQRMDLPSAIKEAQVEAKQYQEARNLGHAVPWLVIQKRRGRPIGEAYVVTTLDEFYRQVEGL